MKTFFIVMLIAVWLFGAALVSVVVTMSSWGAHIEGKAFHCTDGDFPFFWSDMDTHKGAGDTVSPGWTWDKLKAVRLHYIEAFWLIWVVISAVPFLFPILRRRHPNHPAAGKAAITSQPPGGRRWRGLPEPGRSPK